ncbi:MAG: transcription elongation factor GreA [Treponema sp.]|nr:transcription elongation factor GreA [Treponema sp.]
MSEELVTKVQEMLKEETWTRATISNYTRNNLNELAGIVEKAKDENCIDEIKALCDEHLSHTKDSIIALYISGILGLTKGTLDNSALVSLVDIFQKNHKENIVIQLCESILDTDETNKFALRTLADSYSKDNDHKDKVWDLYEKIVRLDTDDAEVAKLLAEHYETLTKDGGLTDTEKKDALAKSVNYYKVAILRFVNARNYNGTKELWEKLVECIPEEIDFFLHVQRKVSKAISPEKSAFLMQDLYDKYYKPSKKWDTAIDILKLILAIDPKDIKARREITECYRSKYADHSNVEEYIRSSNLSQSFRNVFEAINYFEKHIAFDAKHFVYHRTWHVGIIKSVEKDMLHIDFAANGMHDMSLDMAVDALQPLSNNHIWALKARKSKEWLAELAKGDNAADKAKSEAKAAKKDDKDIAAAVKDAKTKAKAKMLKIIIKSFNNSCDLKKIKAELVPSILTAGEWTSWSADAKKILETDPSFGVNPNNINEYIVRTGKISQEQKLNNEFMAQKQFFARIDILMRFLDDETTDKDSDLFADMFSYFTGFVKSFASTNVANEQVVASYLVTQKVAVLPADKRPASLTIPQLYTFEELYKRIENPRAMYNELKSAELKELFLKNISTLPDWDDQYIKLFPTVRDKKILDTLINKGHVAKVQELAIASFDDNRGYRDAILYFFENSRDELWFKEANIPYQKQLIAILNIISQSYREIENHVDTTENRRVIKNAQNLLFKNDTLITYMLESDEDTMTHIYTLVDDIADLNGDEKARLRSKILEKYPDYKFHKKEEKSVAPKGMLVTAKKLEEKKAEEKDLKDVQLPQNAQEISEARAKGDLKENAEYIAAKEHQHFLNKKLSQLQSELARAVIFDPTTATSSYISFGTVVTLLNKDTGKDEKYTILGPWESDVDNAIISYMSPFGNQLLDHKAGEDLDFEINGHAYKFTVKSIKLAKF